jgi:WD40 repeat protein
MVERLAIAGDRLLAGHRDGSATLWDLRTGHSTALPSLSIGDEPGSGVALSPDGLVAVVGAQVWDLKGRPRRVALLAGFEGAVRDVAFLPAEPPDGLSDGRSGGTSSEGRAGGREVITAGDNQIGMIWDVTNPARPRLRARLGGHRDTVTTVATGPGGLVVTGSLDTTAIVWRFADPPREAVTGVDDQSYGIAVGGSSLLTYDSDGGGTLRHLTGARPGPPPTSPLSRPVGRFADARRGVALSVDGTVALVGGERGAVLRDPTGSVDVARGARVSSVALSGDGRVALVGAREGLWVRAGAVTVAAGHGPVTAVAISADGTLGLTASGGRIVPWDLRDPVRPRPGQAVTGHTGEILALAVHGRMVLSGGVDKKAVLWEVDGGALRRRGTLPGEGGEVVGVRFSDDGLLALVSSLDETVGVWLVRDADAPRQVLSLSQAGSGAAFGPGRYEIFASSVQGGLYRWDLRSFAEKIDQPFKAACAMIDCGIQEGQ